MLYAALSCLQGRPMADAAQTLLQLGADGLQLTPGCAPTPDFTATLTVTVPVRTHNGFTPDALRTPVWGPAARLLHRADSLHPPRAGRAEVFFARAEAGDYDGVCFEVMYPGYTLGTGTELRRAMALGLPLALDVAHLHIQERVGVCDAAILRALSDYPYVTEVHLSANDGRFDRHAPMTRACYGAGLAAERARSGVPVVVECYLHRLSRPDAAAQFELARELVT